MSPSNNQDVSEEAAAIGIEVVPIEKLRSLDTEEESFSTNGSSSYESGGEPSHQPQQYPATTAQPRKSRMSRREYMLAAMVLVAFTGLVVGLAVALSSNRSSSNNNNASNDSSFPGETDSTLSPTVLPSSTAIPNDGIFIEDKSYIDNVCSSADDLTLCKVVCAPADCCSVGQDDDDDNNRDSCLTEHISGCVNYAKCHAVMGAPEVVAPPAPLNLHELCLQHATADNMDACREACRAVQCCFDESEDSCLATDTMMCLDYAPCQVLNNKSTVLPPDTQDLLQVCSSSPSTGESSAGSTSEECDTACQAASCCWSQTDNCLKTDLISCLSHAPCNLRLPPPSTGLKASTSNMKELCSVDSLLRNDGSFDQCVQQCQDASCCTATAPEDSCFANDPFTCLLYQPCALVGGSVPPPRPDLEQVCNGVNGLDSDALQMCIDSCEPSACCTAEGEDNCVHDGNALTCALYKDICEPVLAVSDGSLSSPPDTLSQLCSVDNLDTVEGYAACRHLCAPAACCNSLGDDNCLLDNIGICGEWNIGGCYLLSNAVLGGGN